jgi:hypothetical protein
MASKPITIARYLLNEALTDAYHLPDDTILDSKTADELYARLAREQPDKYGEISAKLLNISTDVQGRRGGVSPNIRHLREADVWKKRRAALQQEINKIYSNSKLTTEAKQAWVTTRLANLSSQLSKEVFDEQDTKKNPFTTIVKSGMKGKPANINNLLGSPLLFADPKNRVIPIPVLHGYASGLRPSEYWAASYGIRKSLVDTKLAVGKGGFLSKQMVQIAHRGVVTDDDEPEDQAVKGVLRGLPVDTDDDDNIGALLAADFGKYPRNTVITAKVLRDLRRANINKILVRSPMVGGPQDGGVYAKDVGIREQGRLLVRGENPGVTAVLALSEPISQGLVSSKHSAGVVGNTAGAAAGGFKPINQFIQVPKDSGDWAAHAAVDGVIRRIADAPQGGKYIYLGDTPIYVPTGQNLLVKAGDTVEAGDVLSDGLPNPAVVVEHKGIGEGRRYFTGEFKKLLQNSSMPVHRRNVELLARGLINHVELDKEMDVYVPGDSVPYNMLEKFYTPREDSKALDAKHAVGKYLERPVLHYTIGTKIRPSMLKELEQFKQDKGLLVNDNPPPFHPKMVRGMAVAAHDPDWLAAMQGTGIKARLMKGTYRADSSNLKGTSYVAGVVGDPNFAAKNNTGKIESPVFYLDAMKKNKIQAPENMFDPNWEDDDD